MVFCSWASCGQFEGGRATHPNARNEPVVDLRKRPEADHELTFDTRFNLAHPFAGDPELTSQLLQRKQGLRIRHQPSFYNASLSSAQVCEHLAHGCSLEALIVRANDCLLWAGVLRA